MESHNWLFILLILVSSSLWSSSHYVRPQTKDAHPDYRDSRGGHSALWGRRERFVVKLLG